MSIIKERIKFKNNSTGATITFGLDTNNHLSGYQQEINNLTEETKTDLINPVIDNEVRRFQYDSTNGAIYLMFYFYNDINYNNTFYNGRFDFYEVNSQNPKIQNSFFILDFYDSYDNNTQIKIFTNYLTQILRSETGGMTVIPKYKIYDDTINQFYNWYVSKSFIDEQTGSTVTGYVRFSFYNAKYGDITLFYNKDNQNLSTPEKMYFKTLLNLTNMTWKFDYGGDNFPPNATAYQIPFNNEYSKKINAGVQSFEKEKQVYPTGNTFQSTDGTYYTTV